MAAERAVRTAQADVRRQRRELAEARIRLERRQRYGRKMEAIKREPRVIMGAKAAGPGLRRQVPQHAPGQVG